MDVILEVFDTFLFDRFYATVLPGSTPILGNNIVKDATATFSSRREIPTAIPPTNQLFQLEPSQYAYMSQWGRDNIYRQSASLYLITWYISIYCLRKSLSMAANAPLGYSAPWFTSSALPFLTSLFSTTQPSPTPNT